MSIINSYHLQGKDPVADAMDNLSKIEDFHENPTHQFILEQLQMILTRINGRRYSTHVIILAAEILCISPATYRMLQRIILPREKTIWELMLK